MTKDDTRCASDSLLLDERYGRAVKRLQQLDTHLQQRNAKRWKNAVAEPSKYLQSYASEPPFESLGEACSRLLEACVLQYAGLRNSTLSPSLKDIHQRLQCVKRETDPVSITGPSNEEAFRSHQRFLRLAQLAVKMRERLPETNPELDWRAINFGFGNRVAHEIEQEISELQKNISNLESRTSYIVSMLSPQARLALTSNESHSTTSASQGLAPASSPHQQGNGNSQVAGRAPPSARPASTNPSGCFTRSPTHHPPPSPSPAVSSNAIPEAADSSVPTSSLTAAPGHTENVSRMQLMGSPAVPTTATIRASGPLPGAPPTPPLPPPGTHGLPGALSGGPVPHSECTNHAAVLGTNPSYARPPGSPATSVSHGNLSGTAVFPQHARSYTSPHTGPIQPREEAQGDSAADGRPCPLPPTADYSLPVSRPEAPVSGKGSSEPTPVATSQASESPLNGRTARTESSFIPAGLTHTPVRDLQQFRSSFLQEHGVVGPSFKAFHSGGSLQSSTPTGPMPVIMTSAPNSSPRCSPPSGETAASHTGSNAPRHYQLSLSADSAHGAPHRTHHAASLYTFQSDPTHAAADPRLRNSSHTPQQLPGPPGMR